MNAVAGRKNIAAAGAGCLNALFRLSDGLLHTAECERLGAIDIAFERDPAWI